MVRKERAAGDLGFKPRYTAYAKRMWNLCQVMDN